MFERMPTTRTSRPPRLAYQQIVASCDAGAPCSGPIDEYYGTLRATALPQPAASSTSTWRRRRSTRAWAGELPERHDDTRITEFKHLTGQQHTGTSIVREIPQAQVTRTTRFRTRPTGGVFKRSKRWPKPRRRLLHGRMAQYRYTT